MNEVAQTETPLGLYIHWPYCAKICPYCDFNVFRDRGRKAEQAELFAAIADDLRAQRELTGGRRLVLRFAAIPPTETDLHDNKKLQSGRPVRGGGRRRA